MTNTCSRADGRDRGDFQARRADRGKGPAVTLRMLAIGAACVFMCACGGGAGGGDTTVATPPPAPAELAWDNGNWDQQEWH